MNTLKLYCFESLGGLSIDKRTRVYQNIVSICKRYNTAEYWLIAEDLDLHIALLPLRIKDLNQFNNFDLQTN